MKKLTTIATAIGLFLSVSSFTYKSPDHSNENNEKLTAVLKINFPEAASVSWKEISSFHVADFMQDGKTIVAVYDEDGNLQATSTLITRDEVPADLLKKAEGYFGKGHSGPSVEAVTYKGETTYSFNILTEKFAIRCTEHSDGVITEESRIKLQKK